MIQEPIFGCGQPDLLYKNTPGYRPLIAVPELFYRFTGFSPSRFQAGSAPELERVVVTTWCVNVMSNYKIVLRSFLESVSYITVLNIITDTCFGRN